MLVFWLLFGAVSFLDNLFKKCLWLLPIFPFQHLQRKVLFILPLCGAATWAQTCCAVSAVKTLTATKVSADHPHCVANFLIRPFTKVLQKKDNSSHQWWRVQKATLPIWKIQIQSRKIHKEMLQSSKLQRCGDEAAKKHCGLKLSSLQWCTQLASSFGKDFFFFYSRGFKPTGADRSSFLNPVFEALDDGKPRCWSQNQQCPPAADKKQCSNRAVIREHTVSMQCSAHLYHQSILHVKV